MQKNYRDDCPDLHANAPGGIASSRACYPSQPILSDVRPAAFGRDRMKPVESKYFVEVYGLGVSRKLDRIHLYKLTSLGDE